MSKPLTITEQKALVRTPGWAERTWDAAAIETWRQSQEYMVAVAAIETHRERMDRELAAFEHRQMKERLAFVQAQKRAMDGSQ